MSQNPEKMTSKPCPGCGYKPERRTPYRLENDVCHQCRAKLDGYDRMKQAIAADGARQKSFNLEWGYWNAMEDLYFSVPGRKFRRDPVKQLQRHMYHLYQACSVDANGRPEHYYDPDHVRGDIKNHCGHREMRITIYRKLARLRKSTKLALAESYKAGFEDGNDLLANLASGKVSVEYYNQRNERMQ